jgi:hypothetical protein
MLAAQKQARKLLSRSRTTWLESGGVIDVDYCTRMQASVDDRKLERHLEPEGNQRLT